MIKRLYLANGYLLQPLNSTSNDVAVDANIATALEAGLVIGDHCYLTIVEDGKLEVIRVDRDYSGYAVARAQDGSSRQDFSSKAHIVYRLTSAEIADATNPIDWNIYASGYGTASVVRSTDGWGIYLDSISAHTEGGIESFTDDNNLVIHDRVGMFGCCDVSLTGAPGIDGPFFYLTSQLYAQLAIESMTGNPKNRNGNVVSPLDPNREWYLLDQPYNTENYLKKDVVFADMFMFGGSKAFTAVENYLATTVAMQDILTFGGAKNTTVTENYLVATAYMLELLSFGGAVSYSGADMYISPKVSLSSLELV